MQKTERDTKKIVFIIKDFTKGGAESQLLRLIECYRQFDHEIKLCVFTKSRLGLNNPLKYGKDLHYFKLDPFGIIQFTKLLLGYKPEFTFTWMYFGNIFGGVLCSIFTKSIIVWNIRNGKIEMADKIYNTPLIRIIHTSLSWLIPTKIIYNSKSSKTNHENYGIDKNKSKVIYNFVRNDFRKDFEIQSFSYKPFVIGILSRYDEVKQVDRILNVLSNSINDLGSFQILLGGDSFYGSEKFTNILKSLNLWHKCIINPPISYVERIRRCDLIVSYSKCEALSNVLLDSILECVAFINTKVGDYSLYENNSNFIVCHNSDEQLKRSLLYASALYSDYGSKFLISEKLERRATVLKFFDNKNCQEAWLNLIK